MLSLGQRFHATAEVAKGSHRLRAGDQEQPQFFRPIGESHVFTDLITREMLNDSRGAAGSGDEAERRRVSIDEDMSQHLSLHRGDEGFASAARREAADVIRAEIVEEFSTIYTLQLNLRPSGQLEGRRARSRRCILLVRIAEISGERFRGS
jgi:hypothetical protein